MHAIEKLREFERSSTIKHGILRFNMSSQRLLMFNWAQLSEGINRVCYNVNAGALGDRLWELRRVWLKFAIQKRFDNCGIPCGHWNLDCYKNVYSLKKNN